MANLHLISSLLEKKRMTVKELCEKADISDQTLRQIQKRNSTKTDILERIAAALQVPVGYFFGGHVEVVVSGRNNQVHNGNGDQIIMTPEQKEIRHLKEIIKEKEKIIAEKERLISVLMGKEK